MIRIACILCALSLSLALDSPVWAHDFAALDQAVPSNQVLRIAPVFDFDGDGCLPGAGISRSGEQNGGLKPTGSLGGGCRHGSFLNVSNTIHRQACVTSHGAEYCGHFFALYFLKDQVLAGIQSGHRHDWEYVAVWTRNGAVTHGSYSAHGELFTQPAATLSFENGHVKIVYHKDGVGSHAFRFAGANEGAENPYGRFVTPSVASWFELRGDWDNEALRTLANRYDYGSAQLPVRDSAFLWNLNTFRPADYPEFGWESARNPRGDVPYYQIVNQASGLCLDVASANMASGTDVIQWNCHGADWQAFSYDAASGAMRVQYDPRYCLDNSSRWENGADLVIWSCNGGDAQRFTLDAGTLRMRTYATQVVDGYGTTPGDDVGTWTDWGGANQHWSFRQR